MAAHESQSSSQRRCWYCGEVRVLWSREHVVPLEMGGKLIVRRRVCKSCNETAGRNIDGPFGRSFLVKLQRAAHGIPKRSGRVATASVVGDVDGGGRARIEWNARGGDLQMWDTEPGGRRRVQVDRTELVNVRLWARFSAKVALAVASMGVEEDWLDTRRGRELRAFVHDDVFPSGLWPDGPPLPQVVPKDDPFARVLRRNQHLLSVVPVEGEAVVGLVLFGAWVTAVPIGVNMKPGEEIGWLLDPHASAPEASHLGGLIEELEQRSPEIGASAPSGS